MNEPQDNASEITAKPQVYIEVTMYGRKQVYDVDSANRLHHELTVALNQVEATNGIGQSRRPQKPDGRTPQILGADGIERAAASRQGA